mmetsp:Transcript_6436/g.14204  ORF Transcript_6436/g.14204 Transcript_6436/m.14204 type:complete len:103 (-) Transcript_6436:109-417(-)
MLITTMTNITMTSFHRTTKQGNHMLRHIPTRRPAQPPFQRLDEEQFRIDDLRGRIASVTRPRQDPGVDGAELVGGLGGQEEGGDGDELVDGGVGFGLGDGFG